MPAAPTFTPLASLAPDTTGVMMLLNNGTGQSFTTTMGAATDLPSEGVRRLLVNAAYWAAGMADKISPTSDVSIVGDYHPTAFGFGKYVKGKKPADYAAQ